ncbi:MAG: phosphatase PAP2 family protein [Prevotellaceae bacterium]|nr:phosphatase PAP2 family protein [Prevotellaceae bacterium]
MRSYVCGQQKIMMIFLFIMFRCSVCYAQQSDLDSISTHNNYFNPKQLIAPAALITIGSFGVSNGWFCKVKQDVKEDFYHIRHDHRFRADDYLQYVPLATGIGLGFTGVDTRHPFRERLCVAVTASAVTALIVNVTKYSVREKRPDSEKRNSFPSGHTATAFMGAEMVRMEYGNACGIGAYAFATGIGILRMYNDRHWLNDVIAGAGVGILSTHIAYWLLPYERKLFGWNKQNMEAAIIPTYNTAEHSIGLCFSARF